MLVTPHAVTGATIAIIVPYPIVSIPLSLGSHFLLDTVPHWQETLPPYAQSRATWTRIPIDVALSIGLVWLIANAHPEKKLLIWVTALAAVIPDIDTLALIIPSLFKNRLGKRYWDFHCAIQKETQSFVGILSQLLVSLLCLWMSLFLII